MACKFDLAYLPTFEHVPGHLGVGAMPPVQELFGRYVLFLEHNGMLDAASCASLAFSIETRRLCFEPSSRLRQLQSMHCSCFVMAGRIMRSIDVPM